MTKADLRSRMNGLLRQIDAHDLARRSAIAAQRFQESAAWREAGVVLCFLSMPHELESAGLIDAARASGKSVAVPRIEGDVIRFLILPVDPRDLPRDKWGIPVPDPGWEPFAARRGTDVLMAVPGLAFDRRGNRLGRGKGYYDRFLGDTRAAVGRGLSAIGICLSEQLVDEVPHTERDQRLDGVVTERETLTVSR